MRLPAFDADRSLYAAAGRYRAARTASGGAAGALVPARPKCSNCDDILDRCADNGGFPRAVCNACANGNCYEDGPVPAGPAEQVPARSPAPDQPPNGNSPAHRLAPGDPARAAGAGGMD